MLRLNARGPKVAVALAVLLCLAPGADEAVEQLAHFVRTGHLAHLTEGESDLGHDAEHGCRPSAHACGCCTNVPVVASVPIPWGGVQPSATLVVWGAWSLPRDRARDQLFRPPIST